MTGRARAVVTDTALVEAIKRNLKPPLGALSQYRAQRRRQRCRRHARTLVLYWSAVRNTFPEAWGRPPTREPAHALGRHPGHGRAHGPDHAAGRHRCLTPEAEVATRCRGWRPIAVGSMEHGRGLAGAGTRSRSTRQHISRLSDHLIRLDRELARPAR